jgi:hypothetical protein
MVRVRRGDIDDVDIRILNKLLIGSIGLCRLGRANVFEKFFCPGLAG